MEIAQFAKIAHYLTNPFVLAGFCLFLLFGTYQVLLKVGLFSPLSQRQTSSILRIILNYGFRVSIVIIVFGFAYAGLRAYQDARGMQPQIKQQTGDCGSNINGDGNQANVNCDGKKADSK